VRQCPCSGLRLPRPSCLFMFFLSSPIRIRSTSHARRVRGEAGACRCCAGVLLPAAAAHAASAFLRRRGARSPVLPSPPLPVLARQSSARLEARFVYSNGSRSRQTARAERRARPRRIAAEHGCAIQNAWRGGRQAWWQARCAFFLPARYPPTPTVPFTACRPGWRRGAMSREVALLCARERAAARACRPVQFCRH